MIVRSFPARRELLLLIFIAFLVLSFNSYATVKYSCKSSSTLKRNVCLMNSDKSESYSFLKRPNIVSVAIISTGLIMFVSSSLPEPSYAATSMKAVIKETKEADQSPGWELARQKRCVLKFCVNSFANCFAYLTIYSLFY
jgi:hypothetical protein